MSHRQHQTLVHRLIIYLHLTATASKMKKTKYLSEKKLPQLHERNCNLISIHRTKLNRSVGSIGSKVLASSSRTNQSINHLILQSYTIIGSRRAS